MMPRTSSSPLTGYSVLIPFLRKQDRAIDRVLGDANCLFRALSVQLFGVQEHHLELRRIVAQCESRIKSFEGIHATINQSKYADHVKNIGKTCIWGTNLEIIVTATLFGVDIYLATDSYRPGKPTWLKYSPNAKATMELRKSSISSTIPRGEQPKQWLELTHVNRCHFNAIKPASSIPLNRPVLRNSTEASDSIEIVEL